jgi:hypothetical protein
MFELVVWGAAPAPMALPRGITRPKKEWDLG